MKLATTNCNNTLSLLKFHKILSSAGAGHCCLAIEPKQDTPPPAIHPEPTTSSTASPKIPIHQIVSLLQTTNAEEWPTNTDLHGILTSSPPLSPSSLIKIARRLGSYEKSFQLFNCLNDNLAFPSLSNCLPLDPASISLIFQAVIEHASCLEGPETVAKLRNLFTLAKDQKLPLSTVSAVLMMKCFGQAQLYDESMAVFNELDTNLRNTRAGNLMLESLLKVGQVDSALKLLDQMFKSESGYCPNKSTMDVVLSAFTRNWRGRRVTLEEMLGIVSRFMEKGIFPDAIWLTQLVTSFYRRGSIGDAWGLLHEVMRLGGQVKEVSCNALLTGLSKENDYKRMNSLMMEMKEKDILPNVVTFGILINHLCKNRRIDDAVEVFQRMRGGKEGDEMSIEPDVVIFNTLIDGFCKVGRQEEGMKLMEKMRTHEGCMPDTVTYNSLIDGFCKSGEIDSSLELFDRMSKEGIEPNVITMNTILNGMCRCGRLSRAMDFFDEMQNKSLEGNAVTFTILITAFCSANNIDKAMKLFDHMFESGIRPDAFIYYSLITGLCLAERMDGADHVVSKMREAGFCLDTITFNCLIGGFCRKNKYHKAVELFEEMEVKGMKPDRITYNTLISYFSSKGDMVRACSVLTKMRKDGIVPNAVTYGALIDAYCTQGDVDEAMKIFKDMGSVSKVPANAVIYNILITSLCKSHKIKLALSLFDDMKRKRVRPSVVTYNVLLKGLQEKSRLEKAFEVMNQMTENSCNPDSGTMEILTEWFSEVGQIEQLRSFLQGYKVSVAIRPKGITEKKTEKVAVCQKGNTERKKEEKIQAWLKTSVIC